MLPRARSAAPDHTVRLTGAMRLIAGRTVAAQWPRLLATVAATGLAVGLIAASVQIGLQAQAEADGLDASEYAATDVLVQTGAPGAPELPPSAMASSLEERPLGPEQVAAVARTPGVAAVAGDVAIPTDVVGASGKVVQPPFTGSVSVRPWIPDAGLRAYELVAGRAPAAPDEVVVDAYLARAGNLEVGTDTRLLLPQASTEIEVVGVATVDGSEAAATGASVLMTPQVVQEAAGLGGAWPTLLVRAADGTAPEELRARLQPMLAGAAATLGTDVRETQEAALSSLGVSLAGLLATLSAIGVFVGVFVVAGAFGTLVSQRVPQLALLRTVGATSRQVRRLVRLEALAVGLAGWALGLLAGIPLAWLLAWLLAGNGLSIAGAGLQLSWVYLLVPLATGLAVTQLAAWRAAWRAAGVAPVAALRTVGIDHSARSVLRILTGLGLLAGASVLALVAFYLRDQEQDTGAGMVVVLTGMTVVVALAVLSPYLTVPLGWLVGSLGVAVRAGRSAAVAQLARATIVRNPRRVATGASMLMLAVALATAAGLLLRGIDRGVEGRVDDAVTATHGVVAAGFTGLPGDITERVAAVPGVQRAAPLTGTFAEVVSTSDPAAAPDRVELTGTAPAALVSLLDLAEGNEAVAGLQDGEVAVATGVAAARGWDVGDVVTVRGVQGPVQLTVAGNYRDPTGTLAPEAVVTSATLRAVDPAAFTDTVLVGARPGADAQAVTRDLADALAGVPTAAVHDHDGLSRAVAGAYVNGEGLILGFLGGAVVIAVFGMVITVSLSVSERTREFGLLRAVGATTRQLRAMVRWEAATIVLLGTLKGVGCGMLTIHLAHLLTGSDLFSAAVPITWVAGLLVAAAGVTLLGSLLPARRAARVPPQTATNALM